MLNNDNIVFLDKYTVANHERFLIKHTVPIANQDELLLGELNQYPNRTIVVPPDCFQVTGLHDPKLIEYPLIKKDPVGERKITPNGQLLNGSRFLFNCFKLPTHGETYFVQLKDLMSALLWDKDEQTFLDTYKHIYPIECNDTQIKYLIEMKLLPLTAFSLPSNSSSKVKFVTCKSAYVIFGAAIIASGHRLSNDYWETLGKTQGFTPHHRAYKLSKRLISFIMILKPTFDKKHMDRLEPKTNTDPPSPISYESPYPTITEQPSMEIKQEYINEFSKGQHISNMVPGQSISGALELTAQFRIPKYHSKNSFLQATQTKSLDTPIGKFLENVTLAQNVLSEYSNSSLSSMNGFANSVKTVNNLTNNVSPDFTTEVNDLDNVSTAPSPSVTSKPMKRMLNNLLDVNSKSKKTGDFDLLGSVTTVSAKLNSPLNIDGWKFESLPAKESVSQGSSRDDKYSFKGLPIYDKEKLLSRLKMLTPNQIRELEYSHDSLFFNTGIQKMRSARLKKWRKYWHYKAGFPIGFKANQEHELKTKYLKDMLEKTDVNIIVNEETNKNEIQTTSRIPNANFLGYSNIKTKRPPYVPIPPEVVKELNDKLKSSSKTNTNSSENLRVFN